MLHSQQPFVCGCACPNTGHRVTGPSPVLPQKMPDVASSCLYLSLSLSHLPSPSSLVPSPPIASLFLLSVSGHIREHVYTYMCVQGDHANTDIFLKEVQSPIPSPTAGVTGAVTPPVPHCWGDRHSYTHTNPIPLSTWVPGI